MSNVRSGGIDKQTKELCRDFEAAGGVTGARGVTRVVREIGVGQQELWEQWELEEVLSDI